MKIVVKTTKKKYVYYLLKNAHRERDYNIIPFTRPVQQVQCPRIIGTHTIYYIYNIPIYVIRA